MVIDRLIDEKGNEHSEIITCGAVQGYNGTCISVSSNKRVIIVARNESRSHKMCF